MKAGGCCFSGGAHLLTGRPLTPPPTVLNALLGTHKLLRPYWPEKTHSASHLFQSHRAMQAASSALDFLELSNREWQVSDGMSPEKGTLTTFRFILSIHEMHCAPIMC